MNQVLPAMRWMPEPSLRPYMAPMAIGALIYDHKNFDAEKAPALYPWATRFVLGLPLAPWQREFKWSEEQCQRFITSAWTGVHLGTYLVTAEQYREERNGFTGVEYLPMTNMVIDGQQRLKAIELYVTNQLAVPDVDGKPCFWAEVGEVQRRRFSNTIFSRGVVREDSELALRTLYDVLNFGGIAHDEHERALPPPPSLARLVRP